MFSKARLQQSVQFFLLLGLLLVNRLTLLADAKDREGDSSFTLSNKVFFMAAGEIFSWSAKCCSSLQRGSGGERERERHIARGRSRVWEGKFAGSLGLCVAHLVRMQEASTALIRSERKPPLSRKCRAWMVAPPGEQTLSFS